MFNIKIFFLGTLAILLNFFTIKDYSLTERVMSKQQKIRELFTAAKNGDLEKVKQLLEGFPSINVQDGKRNTLLLAAVEAGKLHIVEYLVEKGADIYLANNDECNVIHIAAKFGHLDILEYISKHMRKTLSEDNYKDFINDRGGLYQDTPLYNTPLHFAACSDPVVRSGHANVVKFLLDSGADPNIKNFHNYVLHDAVAARNYEAMKYLIPEVKDIDAKDNDGDTPLCWAAEGGDIEGAKLLLTHKANINIQNKKGETPLHWAIKKDHIGVAKLLLTHKKADVNIQDKEGKTPLHLAIQKGHIEVAKLLLTHKADINIQDKERETPLHSK